MPLLLEWLKFSGAIARPVCYRGRRAYASWMKQLRRRILATPAFAQRGPVRPNRNKLKRVYDVVVDVAGSSNSGSPSVQQCSLWEFSRVGGEPKPCSRGFVEKRIGRLGFPRVRLDDVRIREAETYGRRVSPATWTTPKSLILYASALSAVHTSATRSPKGPQYRLSASSHYPSLPRRGSCRHVSSPAPGSSSPARFS